MDHETDEGELPVDVISMVMRVHGSSEARQLLPLALIKMSR